MVILIIGILLATAAPSFLGQQNKAYDSAAKQQLATAYRIAKADAVSQTPQGAYETGANLASAIHTSEPELTVDTLAAGSNDESTVANIGVCSQSSPSQLMLVNLSKSGTGYLLEDSSSSMQLAPGNCTGFAAQQSSSTPAEHLYWSSSGSANIGQANLDGTNGNATAASIPSGAATGLVVQSGKLYIGTSRPIDVLAVNPSTGVSGTATVQISSAGSGLTDLAADSNNLYWGDRASGHVYYAPLGATASASNLYSMGNCGAGATPQVLATAAASSNLYWLWYCSGASPLEYYIGQAPLSGGNPNFASANLNYIGPIADNTEDLQAGLVDVGGYLFYGTASGNIMEVSTAGGTPTIAASSLGGNIDGLTTDGQYLYAAVSTGANDTIQKAPVAGGTLGGWQIITPSGLTGHVAALAVG